MKKTISVLLALLLLALTPVCALAAGANPAKAPAARSGMAVYAEKLIDRIGEALGGKTFVENAKQTADAMFERLYQAYDAVGAVPTLSAKELRGTLKKAVSGNDDSQVPEESMSLIALSDLLGRYVFARLENPADLAELIADGAVYDYRVLNDGKGTVIVRVNLREHPELLNAEVFQALIGRLYDRQNEEMLKNGDESVDYRMSYEHIAGELALHALVWAASDEALRLTGATDGKLMEIYRAAVIADLDYGESRLPSDVIVFFGKLIIFTLRFNLLRLFG